MTQRHAQTIALLAAVLAINACSPATTAPDPAETQVPDIEAPNAQASEGVSILRPEVAQPEVEATPQAISPYNDVIGFPQGGSALEPDALAALERALAAPAMPLGLPITLSAHSDSAGSDNANLDASEKRGLAVAGWLIDNGVDASRITVIAFGEQNPAEPNASADGSPNEEGRAANRRVEIEIAAVAPPVDAAAKSEPSDLQASGLEAGD